jgi:ribosomal protein L17
MAESEGGPAMGGKAHHTRQARHTSRQIKCHGQGLCTSESAHIAAEYYELIGECERQEPEIIMPILFNRLSKRYATRPGGYTRVLRIEPEKEDQAPSAILELVDGPKDMRLALTARTIAFGENKAEEEGREFEITDMTAHNIMKVTKFRKTGDKDLRDMVDKFKELHTKGDHGVEEVKKIKVYPKQQRSR